MANRPASQTEWMNWVWFAAGLIFAAGVASAALQDWPIRSWMIVLVGLLLTALRYRSLALVLNVFFIDWLGKMPFGSNPGAVYDHGYCRSSSYGVRHISADASPGCASERGVVCDNGGNSQRLFSIRLDSTGAVRQRRSFCSPSAGATSLQRHGMWMWWSTPRRATRCTSRSHSLRASGGLERR